MLSLSSLAESLEIWSRYSSEENLERIGQVSELASVSIRRLGELAPAAVVVLVSEVMVAVATRRRRPDLVSSVRRSGFDTRSAREAADQLLSLDVVRRTDEAFQKDVDKVLALLESRGVYGPDLLYRVGHFVRAAFYRPQLLRLVGGEITVGDEGLDVLRLEVAVSAYWGDDEEWVPRALKEALG